MLGRESKKNTKKKQLAWALAHKRRHNLSIWTICINSQGETITGDNLQTVIRSMQKVSGTNIKLYVEINNPEYYAVWRAENDRILNSVGGVVDIKVLRESDKWKTLSTDYTNNKRGKPNISLNEDADECIARHPEWRGCDFSLLALQQGQDVGSISPEVLAIAESHHTPILIKSGTDFILYGDSKGDGHWGFTPIQSNLDHLLALPFSEELMLCPNELYRQALIDVLKLGHPNWNDTIKEHCLKTATDVGTYMLSDRGESVSGDNMTFIWFADDVTNTANDIKFFINTKHRENMRKFELFPYDLPDLIKQDRQPCEEKLNVQTPLKPTPGGTLSVAELLHMRITQMDIYDLAVFAAMYEKTSHDPLLKRKVDPESRNHNSNVLIQKSLPSTIRSDNTQVENPPSSPTSSYGNLGSPRAAHSMYAGSAKKSGGGSPLPTERNSVNPPVAFGRGMGLVQS